MSRVHLGQTFGVDGQVACIEKILDEPNTGLLKVSYRDWEFTVPVVFVAELLEVRGELAACRSLCPITLDNMTPEEVFKRFPDKEEWEQEAFRRSYDAGIQHVSEILRRLGWIPDRLAPGEISARGGGNGNKEYVRQLEVQNTALRKANKRMADKIRKAKPRT